MRKEIINTSKAAPPGGSYSQAVKAGNLVFVSGCVGNDPATGKLVAPGQVRPQTRQAIENIQTILAAAGTTLDNVVKVTAFIDNIEEFQAFNEEYSKFFKKDEFPARSTVEIGKFLNGMRIEIEAIAIIPD